MKKYYTFKELKEKFGWCTSEGAIQNQIRYARKRGVIIQYAFKKGASYFELLEDIVSEEEWKTYPAEPYFEVSKTGKVRVAETKKLVGSLNVHGYYTVSREYPDGCTKDFRTNRMVLETFQPIENSENFVADHINGIKTDNSLSNLRWLTQRQNCAERDENYAKLNENYQKLIEKYGYEGLNMLFECILNERKPKN